MTRHWTINGRFLTQPLSGVQRYAREIVSALDDVISEGSPLARNLDLQLFFPSSATDVPRLRKIRLQPAGRIAGHLWEQFVLPARLRGGLLSLGNIGPFTATRHIVCVHDANTRTFPTSYTPAFRLLYRTLIPSLGRTAKMVATVLRFSATELERYGIARHTSATREAASLETTVTIGSPAPHKNIKLILEMADRFAAVGLRIAVAGSAAVADKSALGGIVSAYPIAKKRIATGIANIWHAAIDFSSTDRASSHQPRHFTTSSASRRLRRPWRPRSQGQPRLPRSQTPWREHGGGECCSDKEAGRPGGLVAKCEHQRVLLHLAAVRHKPQTTQPEQNDRGQHPKQKWFAVARRIGTVLQIEREHECGNEARANPHHSEDRTIGTKIAATT